MLDTGFQRLPGDIGNAVSWSFPVLYKVIEKASQEAFFSQGSETFLEAFLDGCHELAALGVSGIATSCGFLARLQPELSARSPVPVATSALLQIPMVRQLIGAGRDLAVLTTDAAALSVAHFAGVGVAEIPPVAGLSPEGALRRDLSGNAATVDAAAQEAELIASAQALIAAQGGRIGALLLECTNMAPHSAALRRATGLPVFDAVSLVTWFHSALAGQPRTGNFN